MRVRETVELRWDKKALPESFTFESPAVARRREIPGCPTVLARPAIWARRCEGGWYVQFEMRLYGLSGTGTNRDRAARDLVKKYNLARTYGMETRPGGEGVV